MTTAATTLDLAALRADTPGCRERNHLNNAGAALMPEPVLRAIREHLDLESRLGGYEAADARRAEIAAVYDAVGTLINAAPANVALVEHATAAFVQALSAVPFRRGDAIVTTRDDYVSNQIQYLSLEARLGIEVVRVPDSDEGGVNLLALEEAVHHRRPRLVAVTHVPTSSGLVQDVESIGAICRRQRVLYLVDACQSVGQMPIDVERIGCDFLSATARKFLRGPRGAGFLYVSEAALDEGLEPLFPDLRGADWVEEGLYQPAPDARRFETWEFAYALVLGMGEAVRYAVEVGIAPAEQRIRALAARARTGLATLPGARVLDRGRELCGIVTVSIEGQDADALVRELRTLGINTHALVRSGAVLDFDQKGVEGALRVSPHYYNTEDEVDALTEALSSILARG
jgi:selenocysteine lyase/cysteine desulfurase